MRWRAIPNPQRTDGSFLCDGPDRVYEDGSPRLPNAVVPSQLPPEMAEQIAAAHNEVMKSYVEELVMYLVREIQEYRAMAAHASARDIKLSTLGDTSAALYGRAEGLHQVLFMVDSKAAMELK